MSLQGQGLTAYQNYLNRSMQKTTEVEKPVSGGLMNRNKPVEEGDDKSESSDYLMDQFVKLQKLRAGLKNV
jgi:hypothetical protein|tara:strand:+ start:976 stop:1188 length:213 start_codon:yes stop_codon:yes gene_type:complete